MIGVISPLFARRQGIDGKLQALVGIFLGLGLSGFVVGDDDSTIGLVDTVDAAHDR